MIIFQVNSSALSIINYRAPYQFLYFSFRVSIWVNLHFLEFHLKCFEYISSFSFLSCCSRYYVIYTLLTHISTGVEILPVQMKYRNGISLYALLP